MFFVRWTSSAGLLALRLPLTLAGLLRPVRRRVRSAAGLLARRWDRSLRLRVIGTTLVISVAVVVVLGIFLIQQIANGLLNSERASAITQTSNGQTVAQDQQSLLGSTASTQSSLQSLAESLQSGSGPGNVYDVVILLRAPSSPLGGFTGNPLMSPSIPPRLADSVTDEQAEGRNDWLYTVPTTLVSAAGQPWGRRWRSGCPSTGTSSCTTCSRSPQQIQTLQLVQKTLILAGAGLVVLLAVIVSLVTRWVVVPIRQAAQAASQAVGWEPRRADDGPAAPTTWPRSPPRSTRWPPACRTSCGNWKSCPRCSASSCRMSRTSCGRR